MPMCSKCEVNFKDCDGMFMQLVGYKPFFLCWKDFEEYQNEQENKNTKELCPNCGARLWLWDIGNLQALDCPNCLWSSDNYFDFHSNLCNHTAYDIFALMHHIDIRKSE